MVRAYRIYVRRGIYFFRGAIALPRRFVAEWRGGDNFCKLTLSMSFRPSVSERRNLSIRIKNRFICRFPQAGVPRQSVVGCASSRDVARNDKEKRVCHFD